MFNTVDPSELEKYICTNEFDLLMSWFMVFNATFNNISVISFIDGGKKNTWRKQTWS